MPRREGLPAQPNNFRRRLPLGLIAGAAVAGYLGVQLINIVRTNFQLRQQTAAMQQQIAQLQSQEAQLNYDIQYYQTDSFKEKEARAKLGLMNPGENVIVLPPVQTSTAATAPANHAKSQSNWKQWMSFLFGH